MNPYSESHATPPPFPNVEIEKYLTKLQHIIYGFKRLGQ